MTDECDSQPRSGQHQPSLIKTCQRETVQCVRMMATDPLELRQRIDVQITDGRNGVCTTKCRRQQQHDKAQLITHPCDEEWPSNDTGIARCSPLTSSSDAPPQLPAVGDRIEGAQVGRHGHAIGALPLRDVARRCTCALWKQGARRRKDSVQTLNDQRLNRISAEPTSRVPPSFAVLPHESVRAPTCDLHVADSIVCVQKLQHAGRQRIGRRQHA